MARLGARRWTVALAAVAVLGVPSGVVAGCGGSGSGSTGASTGASTGGSGSALSGRLRAVVVARHPHDDTAFTEGLVFTSRTRLWESTGITGDSTVRLVDPTSGRVRRRVALDAAYFGEGLAAVGDRLVQLTWRNGAVLRWSIPGLEPRAGSTIDGEGWGLAALPDGSLVASDGSASLAVRDAGTLAVRRRVAVTESGRPVTQLNELEVVDGQVWANVWQTNRLVRIDPTSGRVTASVDIGALVPAGLDDPEAVPNGIAHRPGDPADRLWVTGKRWPTMFEIRLVAA